MKTVVLFLRKKRLINALFLVYLLLVLRLTVFRPGFWPLHLFQDGLVGEPWVYYRFFVQQGRWNVLFRDFLWNYPGNIIGFLPLGGWLVWRDRRCPLWKAAGVGLVLSLTIEGSQYVFGVGSASVSDLMTNTLGAWLGGWLMKTAQWDARRRTEWPPL
ncbi:MAG: VanZ family protein [Clostridiales bacterium]|nr:VanZ family protein [Clostridiales bacterium]